MKINYNKSEVMMRAWKLFKNQDVKTDEMFSDCLKQSWNITKSKPALNFNTIYYKYNSIVLSEISRTVKNIDSRHDLMNEIFIRVNDNLHKYNSERCQFKTWLFAITKNMVTDYHRKNNLNRSHFINMSDLTDTEGNEIFVPKSNSNTSESIETSEIALKIDLLTSKLNPIEKQIFELAFQLDKKYIDIAETLNMPLNTVKVLIYRLRKHLQSELKNEYSY